MPKPRGTPKSGGRKPGTPNKKTAELQERVAESGITPLDFMLDIMRGDACPKDADPAQKIAFHALRFEAAKAAAPYVHAKLSSVDATIGGANGGPIDMNWTVEFVKPGRES